MSFIDFCWGGVVSSNSGCEGNPMVRTNVSCPTVQLSRVLIWRVAKPHSYYVDEDALHHCSIKLHRAIPT